jgi:uncharacterized membrane protein
MKYMRLGTLGSLGAGALLTYFFDPQMGRRRRALVGDKAIRFKHKALDAIDVTSRDLKHRLGGFSSASKKLFYHHDVSDETLIQRVRAKLQALVSHPRSVQVNAAEGRITLSGPILAREAERLVARISSMRGVSGIENRLEVHESAESIPGLQGEAGQRKAGERPDIMQTNWSPSTRFIAATFGAATALYGARKLNVLGSSVAALGTAIFTRALTNLECKRLVGLGAGPHAITVHKILNVAAPVHDVFNFWSQYENFPRFMANIREVRSTGENRSHWVVAGPAGAPVEWDAVVTNSVADQLLEWATTPESSVQHTGRVRFQANPDGRSTRLDIRMSYNPMAGALGHGVASLFGVDPKSQMDQDLNRMKALIEPGTPPRDVRNDDAAYTY